MTPEQQKLINEARADLATHMAEYARSVQMPVHLTGELLKPRDELAKLQEVYRRIALVRDRLHIFHGLYECHGCGHLEGEHHADDCPGHRGHTKVRRPPGWTPTLHAVPAMPIPVEMVEHTSTRCAHDGCIYHAVPGTAHCTQHVPPARVTAQEALEVMKRILERKVGVVEATNDHGHVSRVFVTAEGHRLVFFNDANELDYLESIRMPDGREGEYDDWCPPDTSVYNPADDIDTPALEKVLQW
jgi:hypothetical protein